MQKLNRRFSENKKGGVCCIAYWQGSIREVHESKRQNKSEMSSSIGISP
ncbi:hypothetical protein [Providencia heimbachae]|nr:hypothetical protein [Providencia heimbachae]